MHCVVKRDPYQILKILHVSVLVLYGNYALNNHSAVFEVCGLDILHVHFYNISAIFT